MTRQSEFKKKYDPDTGKFTRQHIWSGERSIFGEGITDKVRSLFGKKTKKQVKFAPLPPKPTASKKAGDKIVKMLSSTKQPQQDINNRVLQIMSGGKII